jgi:hypothetical protein
MALLPAGEAALASQNAQAYNNFSNNWGTLDIMAGHSALETRVNALCPGMTIQTIRA